MPTIASEIQRYLQTGDTDSKSTAWPSPSFIERACQSHADLRTALVAEVRRRTSQYSPLADIDDDAARALVIAKVEPMVRGLFATNEQELVLSAVAQRVIFLTASRIDSALTTARWHRNAWNLANLYLASLGAEPLADGHDHILGMATDQACYVTAAYLQLPHEHDDYVVHEVAHSFHDCYARDLGLLQSERRKYPLDIYYAHRETFAYSCEFYACISRSAVTRKERLALIDHLAADWTGGEGQACEPDLVVDILRRAVRARNGWRVILARCKSDYAARTPQVHKGLAQSQMT